MLIEDKTISKQTVVDTETGEVSERLTENVNLHSVKKVKNYSDFIMVYLEDLSSILKIENGTQIQLLSIIWKESTINNPETNQGNVIAILKDDKERWSKQLKCSLRTIDNALSALVQKDLILRSGRGKYKLNPKCYFKGANTDRLKILNCKIEYKIGENDLFDDRPTVS